MNKPKNLHLVKNLIQYSSRALTVDPKDHQAGWGGLRSSVRALHPGFLTASSCVAKSVRAQS